MPSNITPEQVLQFSEPTSGFLCSLDDNTYGIQFYSFTVRDMESQKVLFSVHSDPNVLRSMPANITPEMAAAMRTIKYNFSPSFLKYKTVGAKVGFGVGNQPVPNFRMIERHYFRNVLVKSFDFQFGFCIPNSSNSWEAIYDMPQISDEWERAIIENPYETKSDSFYFVNNQLIMHNKALYAYNAPEK